ncbi:RagB/SusD family nutrient uptake outer membrane protein [Pedobacter sp. MC2016-15]|uniref:RagB/SusD family nutrient uptake outer membrane protein n=1 Tax=Pedobacter sp. MC2016-15 TaxID=2994473 RepID=UPI0022450F8D|nr:RagB/SusD family nutrient uptake outer membrane protein [Pedobacter sp. MC2016-15]MCX2479708.1 RagB/SusD family nutrient uptake outer membrane protein [Pedobacter sp. MC2016-15]
MKNRFNNIHIALAGLLIMVLLSSCRKDFLDAKPSSNIIQPVTLEDFENLLEGDNFTYSTSALPVLSADEYSYIDYPTWQSTATATERNAYIWASDVFAGQPNVQDWAKPYVAVFYANNILSGLQKIEVNAGNSAEWNYIKGWALFERSYYFYDLTRNFCKAYDPASSNTDLGIPLKLRPEIDQIVQRSTLEQTYQQILKDLNSARVLLGSSVPTAKKNKATAVSAYALQARIFLSMGDYTRAELAADSCLALYNKLIDYNTLSVNDPFPFIKTNDETLFTTATVPSYSATASLVNNFITINNDLLALYNSNDLRRKIFFKPSPKGFVMGGNYFGQNIFPYTGLATDEIYLIKAECAARGGRTAASLSALNTLLVKRFPPSSFVPLSAATSQQALDLVLSERRKELVWRGLRWDDLKRLNKEGAGIVLTRVLNGTPYALLPNDIRYVFPIPSDEIALSGIQQNNR